MSSPVNFREEGIKKITLATEQDRAENYQEAFVNYKSGLQMLAHAIKYESNPVVKDKLMERVQDWMKRAEAIRDILNSQHAQKEQSAESEKQSASSSSKKPAPVSGSGSSAAGSRDEDKTQYRSALQSAILTEKPNVPWDSIAGLEQAKNALKEAIILPMKFPQLFTGNRVPWKGILLFGPPGTGKSQLAKAVATEANSTFFSISSSDLVSKYQGESERLVKELFEMAREQKPSIIFIDEVDSLCGARGEGESESSRRIKTEFLVQMNGVGNDQSGVLVLGATNIPWSLDPAIRRRFEKRIYIPLPDFNSRISLFQICLGKESHALGMDELRQLASMTEGFSGADISTLVRDALYEPIRKLQVATHFRKVMRPSGASKSAGKMQQFLMPCSPGCPDAIEMNWTQVRGEELAEPEISFKDFIKALGTTRKTVGERDLEKHLEFAKEFGMEG